MRYSKTIFLIFLLIFTIGTFLQSQEFDFDHITVSDGLSHSTVECIMQDSEGFIWFGTGNGLNMYNGYDIKTYKYEPTKPFSGCISNNVIRAIFEDSKGNIWVGTEYGLNLFDKKTEKFTSYLHQTDKPESLSHHTVICIAEDKNGGLWIGTRGGGLNKFNEESETFTHYTDKKESKIRILYNYVHDLIVDEDILWIATEKGLNKLNTNTNEIKSYSSELGYNITDNRIYTLFMDNKGILWLGSWEGGLIRFDTEKEEFKTYIHNPNNNKSLSSNIIEEIYEINNMLWIATRSGGLNIFDSNNETFTSYTHQVNNTKSISDNSVMCFSETNEGMLFIGTMMGGVNKLNLNQKKFKNYKPSEHLQNSNIDNNIMSIYEDENKTIWLGTRTSGFLKYSRASNTVKQFIKKPYNPNSLSCNNVTFIVPEYNTNNIIWISTDGGGLNQFDITNESFEIYKERTENSVGNNYIYSIFSEENYVWSGTYGTSWSGGLDRYDVSEKIFKNYYPDINDSSSLSSYIIFSIYRDKSGILWIGTKGGGLNQLDSRTDKFTHYMNIPTDTNSISNNDVFCINEDDYGNLWIGTGGGLNKFNRETKKFTHFTSSNTELMNDLIYGIIADNNGYLWISTGYGISRLNINTKLIHNYDKNDGLQGNIFNQGAYFQSSSGEIMFGGNNGISMFYPDSIINNKHIPKIVITDLKIFNQSVPIGEWKERTILTQSITNTKQIKLNYKDRALSIEFASLDYTDPSKNKYKYMLEGLDNDWIQTDASKRFAMYSNLKPGKYIFKVSGSNNDKIWASEPTELSIWIKPPFWNTLFIKLFFLVILVSVISTIAYYQIIKYKKISQDIAKKAKASILDERNLLHTLIDNVPDRIYIKDAKCRFIVGNTLVAKVMKANSPNDLIGKDDYDFYDKELADKYFNDDQAIIKSKKPIIGQEEPGLDEQGNPVIVSTTKIPLFNSEGESVGLVGIGRDITELKKAEEKLRKHAEELHETNVLLEERQEEIFQQKEEISALAEELEATNVELVKLSVVASETDNAVMIVNNEGGVEWINDGFTRLYGYTFENISNKEKKHFHFKPKLHDFIEKCIKTKKTINYEANITTKRNHKIWVQTMLTPIKDDLGRVKKIVAIDSDITMIKEAEAEIRVQKDELTTLNATKDKFFSIIAHDLKNPFHAITSFAELLINNYDAFDREKKKEVLGLIRESSESAHDLLQNLLEWAQTQSNRIKFNPEKIQFHDLLEENIKLLTASVEKKNITLKVDCPPKATAFIDKNMINTVLRNLISNAIKFTNQYGTVSVNVKKYKTELIVNVSDTGVGMDDSTIKNLFSLQANISTAGTSGETGTGLGLIVCKEFIEINGGTIKIKSKINQGSSFLFTIPLK